MIWWPVFLYFLLTEILILIFGPAIAFSSFLLINRLLFVAAFVFIYYLKKHLPADIYQIVNVVVVYTLLSFVYNETAVYNTLIFSKIDAQLAAIDQGIFGFQPAIEFSKAFSGCFWNELFFFGYFSYYLMPLIVLYLLWRHQKHKIEEFGFVVIGSFFIYYVLFILFPAAGPQFYYPSPQNSVASCGVFGHIMQWIQGLGESPTGAFPSSHVGVSCVIIIWLLFNYKKYIKYFLPVVVLLIFSTIYIKAHYAIDSFTGILTAPVVYFIAFQFYKLLSTRLAYEYYYKRSKN